MSPNYNINLRPRLGPGYRWLPDDGAYDLSLGNRLLLMEARNPTVFTANGSAGMLPDLRY
jgi:hypothetical protein